MKKTVKKTEKVKKPAFIVDLTNVETPNDIYVQFGLAKQRAGLAMTDDELIAIYTRAIEFGVDTAIAGLMTVPHKEYVVENGAKLILDEFGNAKIKKPNMFKRFWRWITRKK